MGREPENGGLSIKTYIPSTITCLEFETDEYFPHFSSRLRSWTAFSPVVLWSKIETTHILTAMTKDLKHSLLGPWW